MSRRRITDTKALDCIRDVLSGTEWEAATLESVAEYVRMSGREVNDFPFAPVTCPGHEDEWDIDGGQCSNCGLPCTKDADNQPIRWADGTVQYEPCEGEHRWSDWQRHSVGSIESRGCLVPSCRQTETREAAAAWPT